MSDTLKKVRVVLGPVARKLVEGFDTNRAEALDEAIQNLMNKARNPGKAMTGSDSMKTELAALKQVVGVQHDLIKTLQDVVILEQRMTRIYIASTLSETDEEQRELLEFAAEAVEQLIDERGVISERELEDLKSVEEVAETAMRRELERGVEEDLDISDPELER